MIIVTCTKYENLALNSFISYSSIPLKLIGVLGLLITGAGLCVLLWMIATTIITPELWNYTPLAFVVVINLILTGVILTALGLMSLYIRKIYSEVQNRPLYIVRKILNLNKIRAASIGTLGIQSKLFKKKNFFDYYRSNIFA